MTLKDVSQIEAEVTIFFREQSKIRSILLTIFETCCQEKSFRFFDLNLLMLKFIQLVLKRFKCLYMKVQASDYIFKV